MLLPARVSAAEAPPGAQVPPGAQAPPAEQPGDDSAAGDTSPSETPPDELQPTVTDVEQPEAPSGGGVAGAIVDPNDPNATRAQSDLEGESLDTNMEGVPERLPKLQAAGWWLTFTAVALGTTGGIFAGVAETRQDEAERIAYAFDLETGRASHYADVADEYERVLNEGQTYQWVARGFIIAGGVTLVAGIVAFSVDGVRRRKSANAAARLRLEPGPGLRLRF